MIVLYALAVAAMPVCAFLLLAMLGRGLESAGLVEPAPWRPRPPKLPTPSKPPPSRPRHLELRELEQEVARSGATFERLVLLDVAFSRTGGLCRHVGTIRNDAGQLECIACGHRFGLRYE